MTEFENIIKKIDEENKNKTEEETIIAVSNSYIQKFYLDERLESLPTEIKNELKILMINITEEDGGILECRFLDKETQIYFVTYKDDEDFLYDEIGANLHMRKTERENSDFFESLAVYCKLKFHNVDKFIDKHNHEWDDKCNCEHKHDN